MARALSRMTVGEDQRIGLRYLFDGDRRDGRRQRPIHGLDELVGDDGVAGVRGVNAVQREQPAHESGRQLLATHHHAVGGQIVEQ